MKSIVNAAGVSGIALALVSLSACGGGSAKHAGPAYDRSVQAQVAKWLVTQAPGGVAHNEQYKTDDYSLSADIGIGLARAGGHQRDVATIAKAVQTNAKAYTSPGFGTLVSAGSTAKAAVLEQLAGSDPSALITQLEKTVGADGRIADVLDPKDKKASDYANTFGQAYAAWSLSKAKSQKAQDAVGFLLQQQCKAGWFRVTFTADKAATDQSCDGAKTAVPDVDATAISVIALQQIGGDEADDAAAQAIGWLKKQQAKAGSFVAATSHAANADSTGLAGWALGDAHATKQAGKAATWVARHELTCGADAGAIAYDDAALTAAKAAGVTVKTRSQFGLATAQALPVLAWLPKGAVKAAPAKATC